MNDWENLRTETQLINIIYIFFAGWSAFPCSSPQVSRSNSNWGSGVELVSKPLSYRRRHLTWYWRTACPALTCCDTRKDVNERQSAWCRYSLPFIYRRKILKSVNLCANYCVSSPPQAKKIYWFFGNLHYLAYTTLVSARPARPPRMCGHRTWILV